MGNDQPHPAATPLILKRRRRPTAFHEAGHVAGFLCRSGTVEEVKRKAEELGCCRPTRARGHNGQIRLASDGGVR
jgi:hypothetical protein